MKTYKEFLIAEESKSGFDIVQIGGSIGERSVHSVRDLKGKPCSSPLIEDPEKAKEALKRRNKGLSPGEKKYYGIKYKLAKVENGKYTGK